MSSSQQIPSFIQTLAPVVSNYGYLGVGSLVTLEDFGVPAPGETVLITAAFYAGLGQLNIFAVVIVGFLGAVIGDNIGFAIGDFGGRPLVEKLGRFVFLTPKRLDSAEKFFNRHGGKVVVLARFVEGFRQLNGIIAGVSDMKWPKFVLFNCIGAALWVALWSAVGYFGGSHIQAFLKYQLYVTVAVLVGLVAFISYKVWEKHKGV